MSNSHSKRKWIVVAVIALLIQIPVSILTHSSGQIGPDGPDFLGTVLLFTELPGWIVGENLFGVTSPACLVLGFVSGSVEWFILISASMFFWNVTKPQNA